MNSVTKHLGARTKAATLFAMRSALDDVLLVVEGDEDVRLLSNCLGLPRAVFLVCGGKEVLMELIDLGPAKGIDDGTIFVRDRDCDTATTGIVGDALLVVTGHYDLEMDFLATRLFRRIFNEFAREGDDSNRYKEAWSKLCMVAGALGSLRRISLADELYLDFKEAKLTKFVDLSVLELDLDKMLNYFSAKSSVAIDAEVCKVKINDHLASEPHAQISRGKDFIALMALSFARFFGFCSANECKEALLAQMIRISATTEDFARLIFYESFKNFVDASPFNWRGRALP